MKYIFLFIILSLFIIELKAKNADEETIMNIYYSKTSGKFTTKISTAIDEDAVASATYKNSYETQGWDFLTISSYEKPDNKYDDSIKSYAMGYLEGLLNKDRIYSIYRNLMHFSFYDNDLKYPESLVEFLTKNLEYMKTKSLKLKDSDPYWEHVFYIYQQMLGMFDGYNSVAETEKKLGLIEFQMVVANADMEDAVYYQNKTKRPNFKNMTVEEIQLFTALHTHCSALIKIADDLSDIWMGHNTWTTYGSMIRTFKEYRFVSNKQKEKSKVVVFSSYPGSMSSVDDFYYLDSKLVVMETTNSNFNDTLYDLLKPETILTWVRVMVANRLASSGEEWVEIFKRENSGTYNNQFQVLDLNKVNLEKKEINEKALMVIEQLPEYTESADLTQVLTKGYWPSYNIPYFKKIYEMSGYVEMIGQNESLYDSYDYSGSDRPKIYRREQTNVKNAEDFGKLLRYNDYEEDDCSKKNAAWTIAARYDLNTKGVGRALCYGAIDVKFISAKELLGGKNIVHIISGPTNDKQPTFSWKNTTCYQSNPDRWYHEDVIDTWDFPWIDYQIQLFDN
jgi:hypothetical protein